MARRNSAISVGRIERSILFVRGTKVILDKDLAQMYGVETFNLNKAVKRNLDRFPPDFMFQLTREEFNDLIFQFGISRWGGTRKPPFAFTELGVAMLSSVLSSIRAVQVNIQIMRAFVTMREALASHKDLSQKLETMERKYDRQFKVVFEAIRRLLATSDGAEKRPRHQIGFRIEGPKFLDGVPQEILRQRRMR